MGSAEGLRELEPGQFTAELGTLTAIYAAAMNASAVHLPDRRALMERHAGYQSFRAIVAYAAARRPGGASPIVGFAYGFPGVTGQWWHDLVVASLRADLPSETARWWLSDSFEVAEVHVQPSHQGIGIGRAMMHRLTGGLPERTAVLSTPAGDTRAWRLYRSLGFRDLLPAFQFPGAEEPYAIMGAALPLRDVPRPASPSRR